MPAPTLLSSLVPCAMVFRAGNNALRLPTPVTTIIPMKKT